LRGSKQDLHSGSFGGSVKNPVHALADMLHQLKDENGRIAIPGFYDDVVDLSPEEREALGKLPLDEEAFRREIGANRLYGEAGYTILENIWCRPTLDVCGIWGGFTGEGAKTIIPAQAHAKVSVRLVPRQEPGKIGDLFEEFIRSIAPPQVELAVERMHGGMPFLADTTHPSFQAAREALRKGFGAESVFIREGGSIPFVQTLTEALEIPCLLIGFALHYVNSHAHN
ncbi:MAG: peptidase dimerization domain-containing protein, partial [Fidelibacterota bacterium]